MLLSQVLPYQLQTLCFHWPPSCSPFVFYPSKLFLKSYQESTLTVEKLETVGNKKGKIKSLPAWSCLPHSLTCQIFLCPGRPEIIQPQCLYVLDFLCLSSNIFAWKIPSCHLVSTSRSPLWRYLLWPFIVKWQPPTPSMLPSEQALSHYLVLYHLQHITFAQFKKKITG